MRADGTCSKIDMSVINEVKALVMAFKRELDHKEVLYAKKRKELECTDCQDYQMTYELLTAHNEYRKSLDLLLALLWLLPKDVADEAAAVDPYVCPMFVPGIMSGRPHCETWTSNITSDGSAFSEEAPSRIMCGVLCRNEEKCVGFNYNNEQRSCVWFDDLPPVPGAHTCTNVLVTQYVRKSNGTLNQDMWAAVQRVHVFEEKMKSLLKVADLQGEIANDTFIAWNGTVNTTLRFDAKRTFIVAKDNYTATLGDLFDIKKNFVNATRDAYKLVNEVAEKDPPCGLEFVKTVRTTTTTTTTTTTPAIGTPYPLRWQDFPNSEDTAWSQVHPECPMGTPCFCDCKCRGAPPQNFVEPPPVPPAPCPPPPPTPDPSRMSLPMGAPPALPVR